MIIPTDGEGSNTTTATQTQRTMIPAADFRLDGPDRDKCFQRSLCRRPLACLLVICSS
ncbi:MAG: hypothetical protein MZU97_09850 [Bacillus subtilis]|nr:hypothetical protein [Bacillus subtilis]